MKVKANYTVEIDSVTTRILLLLLGVPEDVVAELMRPKPPVIKQTDQAAK